PPPRPAPATRTPAPRRPPPLLPRPGTSLLRHAQHRRSPQTPPPPPPAPATRTPAPRPVPPARPGPLRGQRVEGAGDDLGGERLERLGPVQVADAGPQRGDRDRLHLGRRPGEPAPRPL